MQKQKSHRLMTFFSFTEMVRKEGLEPSHLAVLTPEASASTNSATFASSKILIGDPDENRTHDHQLRKLILYPTELRVHQVFLFTTTKQSKKQEQKLSLQRQTSCFSKKSLDFHIFCMY